MTKRCTTGIVFENTKDTKEKRLNLTFSFNQLKHRTTQKSTEDTEMTRTQAMPLHSPQNQRHCERSEAIRKDSLAIMVIMEMIHYLL